ncbi:MAG: hypothetical protein CM1200mP3_18600 [Chloroflexota bacterium]|nr:MAG: hypothetical protein CM1200mP3_18600 [Chloroflexota bacterium]
MEAQGSVLQISTQKGILDADTTAVVNTLMLLKP